MLSFQNSGEVEAACHTIWRDFKFSASFDMLTEIIMCKHCQDVGGIRDVHAGFMLTYTICASLSELSRILL